MPGTPDPVLGSETLTLGVATVVATLFASVPYAVRNRPLAPAAVALSGGLAYAIVCLGSWAGARLVTDSFVPGFGENPTALMGFGVLGLVVLGLQAGIPYYLYARSRFVAPLGALFVVTMLILPPFLSVRGESDPVALYALFFGPALVAATCVLGLAEYVLRRFVLG